MGRENGNLGQGNCSCCNCQSNSKTHLLFFFIPIRSRALSMFLYLSLFLAPSLLSKQITNICACATAHSRDTDTHRHTQYTGTQGHPIPPFVLRLIVYTAQIILRTGCICSSGYFRLFLLRTSKFAAHTQPRIRAIAFSCMYLLLATVREFSCPFREPKRRVACCVSRTIFGWLESRKGGFSRCSPCT